MFLLLLLVVAIVAVVLVGDGVAVVGAVAVRVVDCFC